MSYNILATDDTISICKDCDSQLKSFIDIYCEDEDTPSPFRDVDDAYLFAEIMVKLLNVITESD